MAQGTATLGEKLLDRLRFHQFARLVEMVVDDRLGLDAHAVIDRSEHLAGVHGISQSVSQSVSETTVT